MITVDSCVPIAEKVSDLLFTIAQVTGVCPDEQVLILRWKKENTSSCLVSPATVGIVDGTVALTTGGRAGSKTGLQRLSAKAKQSNAWNDAVLTCLRTLRDAEKAMVDLRKQLTQRTDAVTRHTKGFLDKDMTDDALKRDDVV